MVEELLPFISLVLSIFAIAIAFDVRGQMKAPVLRQYVEKYVPLEMTKEREKEIENRMKEGEDEWAKMYATDANSWFKGNKKDHTPEDLV